MPLGTQGGINLPIGYSDSALVSGGIWTPDAARRFWAEHATPITERDDIRGETAKAEVGQRAALAWALSNLARLPALMALKARDLWNDPWSDPRRGLLVLFALAALPWGLREGRESLVLWAVLALNTAGVMLTYGDGVRFLVPVKPLLFALVGLGLWRTGVLAGELARKVVSRRRG
jgi:hypothetical protein